MSINPILLTAHQMPGVCSCKALLDMHCVCLGKTSMEAEGIESGVQEGTLTPKEAGVGMLTLSGWSAALGLLSLIAVVIGGALSGYWKYKGYDRMTAYTQVSKAERAASAAN